MPRAGRKTFLKVGNQQFHCPGMRFYVYWSIKNGCSTRLSSLGAVQRALGRGARVVQREKDSNEWREIDGTYPTVFRPINDPWKERES